jgi:hypothetical protein
MASWPQGFPVGRPFDHLPAIEDVETAGANGLAEPLPATLIAQRHAASLVISRGGHSYLR